MSPVFRHGRLRLYLLKLLDEAPRHGYEVIRLLQDRFMGVYAPSPGTIYPRLARLEEEGLVTHDEADGKKVYRITDKGREEIQSRLEDLADLEEEITESVRDIAREVTEDVRDTVRNLREELTAASREVRDGKERARDTARETARRAREEVRDSARQARDELHGAARGGQAGGAETRGAETGSGGTGSSQAGRGEAGRTEAGRGQDRAGGRRKERVGGGQDRGDWAGWPEWPGWTGWTGRPGWRGWPDQPGSPRRPGRPSSAGRPDAGMARDLERMALGFARDLLSAAWRTESVGTDALTDLRTILEDTLTRIKDEIFGGPGPRPGGGSGEEGGTGNGEA
jgi:DNA-binding PadR family transcriptional regulator